MSVPARDKKALFVDELGRRWKPTSLKIVKYLGGGGFGNVCIVEACGRQYVMKSLLWDPKGLEPSTVIREKEAALRIDHPRCDKVLKIHEPTPGVTLFFRPMRTLGNPLDEYLRIMPPELIKPIPLARDLAEALTYLHSQGLMHLDIKPANVIVVPSDEGPRALLTDFGLACWPGQFQLPQCRARAGTSLYIRPIEEGPRDYRAADVYSLVLTLYWLWEGKGPLARSSPTKEERAVHDKIKRGEVLSPEENRVNLYDQAKRDFAKSPIYTVFPEFLLNVITFKTSPSAAEVLDFLGGPSGT